MPTLSPHSLTYAVAAVVAAIDDAGYDAVAA